MESPEEIPPEVLEDARWFDEHLEEIRKDHEGKYIGVVEKKIIAVGSSLDEVLDLADELREKGVVDRLPFVAVANDTRAVFRFSSFIRG